MYYSKLLMNRGSIPKKGRVMWIVDGVTYEYEIDVKDALLCQQRKRDAERASKLPKNLALEHYKTEVTYVLPRWRPSEYPYFSLHPHSFTRKTPLSALSCKGDWWIKLAKDLEPLACKMMKLDTYDALTSARDLYLKCYSLLSSIQYNTRYFLRKLRYISKIVRLSYIVNQPDVALVWANTGPPVYQLILNHSWLCTTTMKRADFLIAYIYGVTSMAWAQKRNIQKAVRSYNSARSFDRGLLILPSAKHAILCEKLRKPYVSGPKLLALKDPTASHKLYHGKEDILRSFDEKVDLIVKMCALSVLKFNSGTIGVSLCLYV